MRRPLFLYYRFQMIMYLKTKQKTEYIKYYLNCYQYCCFPMIVDSYF